MANKNASGGASFVKLLTAIDYPGASELDPGSLEWMFDDSRAAPFLEWLISSISRENFIAPEIRKRYDELKAKGKVLRGDAIREAMRSLEDASGTSGQLSSVEDMQNEIAELRARSEQLTDREQLLRRLSGDLSSQAQLLRMRSSSLETHEAVEKKEFLSCLLRCEQDVAKVGSTVQSLSESVEAVATLYADSAAGATRSAAGGGGSGTRQRRDANVGAPTAATFLSLASLDGYLSAELAYSGAVTAYTNKKFFEAIGDVASHKDDDYYVLLDVADPRTIVVCGDGGSSSSSEVSEECKELLRIQKTYPTSRLHLVNAQLDQAYSVAALGAARSSMSDLTNLVRCDERFLRVELEKLTAQCSTRKRQITKLRDGPLAGLLLESAGASEARILTGNYDLKLARQNYFLTSQDQVIDKLLSQRARFELLSMLLEVEARHHRETQSLVGTIRASLRAELDAHHQRTKAVEDACFAESKFERATVDSRCSWLVTASELLGIKGTYTHLFVTYTDVADGVRSLCSRLDESHAKQEQLRQRGTTVVQCLDGAVRQAMLSIGCPAAEQQLGDASLSGALPLDFAPRAFAEASGKLEKDLAALETSVLELLKTVEQKKKQLRQDSAGKAHRQLFRTFYTEPHRLNDMFDMKGDS